MLSTATTGNLRVVVCFSWGNLECDFRLGSKCNESFQILIIFRFWSKVSRATATTIQRLLTAVGKKQLFRALKNLSA